ncbi:hypothetical protein [Paeniglutamicibacter sp. Y32M11]|uniref:hypothetical protein n=1 Tax=Paeniglutamicibacter sp. Y32M11 TaxID=2853258 RepID=UPI001C52F1FD|nr:hypothetical protein [Paeniglutamicibacter sp. Y32M11]QXQ09941.1 hypothetical protein KUF55_16110 [Paeniglutamicibacter sp. Y32M11]
MRGENRHHKYQYVTERWHRWALNFGAVLGSLCLILAALTFMFGLKPLIFASGSMGPQIPTGSLGIAVPTPVAEVSLGQVVSVVTSEGTRITHRVLENRPEGLVLKGDANAVADLQPYAVADADRLLFSIPLLGYVVSWFSQPWAFFLGGLLCAYLLYVAFLRPESGNSAGDDDRGEASVDASVETAPEQSSDPGWWRRTFVRTGTVLAVLALVAGLGLNTHVERTQAAFHGSAIASAGVTAALATRPVSATCANLVNNKNTIKFTWSSPPTVPTKYRVEVVQTTKSGGTMVGGKSGSVEIDGTATSYETSNANSTDLLGSLLGILLGYDMYFTVSITSLYGSKWSSTPVTFAGVNATAPTLLILGEYKLTCPANPTA